MNSYINPTRIVISLVAGLVFYLILRARIIALPCFGCSQGSWWYRCWPETGQDSIGCKVYQQTEQTIGQIESTAKELYQKTIQLGEQIEAPIKKAIDEIEHLQKQLEVQIPHPHISGIPKVDFSCGFTIPVINQKINPCEPLVKGINETTKEINTGLRLAVNDSINATKVVLSATSKGIRTLTDQLIKIFDLITPFKAISKDVREISDEVEQLATKIEQIGIFRIIKLGILKTLADLLPIKNLYLLLIVTGIIILLPIIGNLYSTYLLLNNLLGGSLPNILLLLVGSIITLIVLMDLFNTKKEGLLGEAER